MAIRARLEDDEAVHHAEAARLKAEQDTEAQNKAWMEGSASNMINQSSPSPPTTQDTDDLKSAWEQEKERRINEKVAAARSEAEAELAIWEAAGAIGTRSGSGLPVSSSTGPQGKYDHSKDIDDVPKKSFTNFMQATNDKAAKKKSARDKRREYELRVRAEDGVEGPCDFNVAGGSWEL